MEDFMGLIITLVVCFFIAGLLAVGLWGCPQYNVWQKTLSGKAQLKEAEWNRQIAVQEAEAKKQSAVLLAEAEVERSKGVAKANKIIGEALEDLLEDNNRVLSAIISRLGYAEKEISQAKSALEKFKKDPRGRAPQLNNARDSIRTAQSGMKSVLGLIRKNYG